MPAIHTEAQFEDEVCQALKDQGWLMDGPLPYQKGFAYDQGYDRGTALYPDDAIAWVKETQPEVWEKFAKNHAKNPEGVFIQRLAEELDGVEALFVTMSGTHALMARLLYGTGMRLMACLRLRVKDVDFDLGESKHSARNQARPGCGGNRQAGVNAYLAPFICYAFVAGGL